MIEWLGQPELGAAINAASKRGDFFRVAFVRSLGGALVTEQQADLLHSALVGRWPMYVAEPDGYETHGTTLACDECGEDARLCRPRCTECGHVNEWQIPDHVKRGEI